MILSVQILTRNHFVALWVSHGLTVTNIRDNMGLMISRRNKMVTKIVYTSSLCADAVYMAIQIIERIGWCHDDIDEDGNMLVNVPIEDEHLFDFLDNCIFC
jgi:hypothetical protein